MNNAIAEKLQSEGSGQEMKKEIRKKRQYNNKNVFQLCRQTLIIINENEIYQSWDL